MVPISLRFRWIVPLILSSAVLPPPAASPPAAPILSSPANGAAVRTLLPPFYWHKAEGASSYTLQTARDSAFSMDASAYSPYKDTVNLYPIPDAPVSFWRVNASNADGTGPWSEIRRLILLPPEATAALSPANGARHQAEGPELNWKGLDAAATYNLEIAEDSGFMLIKYAYTDLQEHTLIPDPLGFGTYYWHARAVNAAGAGPWSPVSRFTVELPDPPVLSFPPDDSTGVSPSTYLDWETSIGASRQGYGFEVAEDTTFASPLASGTGVTAEYSFLDAIVHLQPGKRYYWRAYATNSSQGVSWSRPWSFTTLSSPGWPPRLVARWDFEEGEGGPVMDKSGNGHNGAVLGEAIHGGAGGRAMHFNGRSEVAVPFDPQFHLDRFTLMAWVNVDSGSYSQCIICRVPTSSTGWALTGFGFNFQLTLGGKSDLYGAPPYTPVIAYRAFPDVEPNGLDPRQTSVFAANPLSLGKWHHLAATFENRRLRLYVDGMPAGAKDSLPAEPDWWDDTAEVILGSEDGPGGGRVYYGWLDETRIYSYALSAGQIDSAYRAFTPATVPPVPLRSIDRGRSRIRLTRAGEGVLRITGLAAPAHVEIRGLSGRKLAEWDPVRNGQTLPLAPAQATGLLLIRITEPGGESWAIKLPAIAPD